MRQPVILAMDSAIKPEEIEDFIVTMREFAKTAKEQYPNQEIEMWILPSEMCQIFMEAQNG